MSRVQDLVVQDVRCFEGAQSGRLRPITLLVGENSTGKSTFLACHRILSEVLNPPNRFALQPNFNEDPFLMGSFRDIVRSRRGPKGRIDAFGIGLRVGCVDQNVDEFLLLATFSEEGSQPRLSSYRWSFTDNHFVEVGPDANGIATWRIPGLQAPSEEPFAFFQIDPATFNRGVDDDELEEVVDYLKELFPDAGGFFDWLCPHVAIPEAITPLRAKPARTYDPIGEIPSSEGRHVPMLMMRLDRTDHPDWEQLRNSLVEFGRESGLFSDVRAKRLGAQMSDPFQLHVKVRNGPRAILMDVGYGVSQILPILVDVMRPGGRTFLLQQPEVHLHPRGQAALASLFVNSANNHRHQFLIETHSDYIVDRVRICVRKREIAPEDVSILYFEPRGNAVTIHSLTLDADGNLEGTPAGYRAFFARETDELLGFTD